MPAPSPRELVQRLKAAADAQRGSQPHQEFADILNGVARRSRDDRDTIIQIAGDMLPDITSPSGAGIIGIWLGGSVEHGRDPQTVCRPVLTTFLKWCHRIEAAETDGREHDPTSEPDNEVLEGLRLLGTALVAVVSRLPEQVKATLPLADLGSEAERIEPVSIGAAWVLQLLRQNSGQLIVLDVEQKKGCLVRYENLSNCFHLFTLLQGAIADMKPQSAHLSEQAMAVARGEQADDVEDAAWWHYGQPHATTADVAASVWGEAGPAEIGSVDGTQVLLLWPPVLGSRTWDSGFFHPILHAAPPRLELVRNLTATEINAWWMRLGLPERRRGWRFWS